ncbi:MAG TPA: SRPBCC domain-containing protein [Sphingobium sp.]|uniref:SRPBCC domain-containing protein n=1 Tax=Sphingobium sp. TaxID=1912891 RepID=UPI002ED2F399
MRNPPGRIRAGANKGDGVEQHNGRIDRASRIILAAPRVLYRAFVDAERLANWRAPAGMSATIRDFDPRVGGGYVMVLRHTDPAAAGEGKTNAQEDHILVRFAEIIPEELIEEEVRFVSDDPAFARAMTLTTRFTPVKGGTKVSFEASNVPDAITAGDHIDGMDASLRNLALVTE